MKKTLTVQLKEIPAQGLDFHFDRNNLALNRKLKSLIGENFYDIQVHIRPAGADCWVVQGCVQAQMNLSCARCAFEFQHKIKKSFNERLLLQPEKGRRASKFVQFSEDELCTVLFHPLFSLEDFIFELIAVEEPQRPLKGPSCDIGDDCENLIAFQKEIGARAGGADPVQAKSEGRLL